MYSCYSIQDCYNLFSDVKLSIRSFHFISASAQDFKILNMIFFLSPRLFKVLEKFEIG